jgi:hypothetical protein
VVLKYRVKMVISGKEVITRASSRCDLVWLRWEQVRLRVAFKLRRLFVTNPNLLLHAGNNSQRGGLAEHHLRDGRATGRDGA